MKQQVIAFDVFNTVVDLSSTSREERHAYADHIAKPWSPLTLPESWEHLPAFPDSAEGLERLRKKFMVVTCSNGPLGMMARLLKNAGLQFDAIIPLELNKVFKPNFAAYMTVCEVLGVEAPDVTMVTANKKFGDIEAAEELGMNTALIRWPGMPQTITELAELLGC